MTYLYKISKPEDISEATPILVTLHGMGTDYNDLTFIAGEQIREKVIQIDLQGDLHFSSGYTYFIPDYSRQPEEQVISDTLAKLDETLDSVFEKEKITGRHPLFFLGFSQGAILSLSYALVHPEKTRGAVVLSGRLPAFVADREINESAGKKPSFFVAQGQFDPLFSRETGQAINHYLISRGLKTEYHEYPTAHGVIDAEVLDLRNWLAGQF
jgi:Predicted esterase